MNDALHLHQSALKIRDCYILFKEMSDPEIEVDYVFGYEYLERNKAGSENLVL